LKTVNFTNTSGNDVTMRPANVLIFEAGVFIGYVSTLAQLITLKPAGENLRAFKFGNA
jgi:hypothetical protein